MRKKLTFEYIKEKVELSGEYELISEEYLGNKEKLEVKHLKCGRVFLTALSTLNQGGGCKICGYERGSVKRRTSIEVCRKEATERGYVLLSKTFKNSRTKMKFKHIKCGNVVYIQWRSFHTNGTGCKFCYGKVKPKLTFCVAKASSRGYELLNKRYSNNRTKMKFKHLKCGRTFMMTWHDFNGKRNQGCPHCASEQKESKIATELKEYYIKYMNAVPEARLLKNPKTNVFLRFDIFIPKSERTKNSFFIEIHGNQHYEYSKVWHRTIENFEYSKKKDKMKKKYAEKNGIYVEIDLRKIKTTEEAIKYIDGFYMGK